LKLIHVSAVILFLGNIVTGLFWHAIAARTRDPRILHFVMDGIIRSDRLFTIPGVVVIISAGLAAAIHGGYPILRTEWIAWSLALFAVSGLAFTYRVAPLQRKLRDMAAAGEPGGAFDYEGYHAVARRWEGWGALALLTPIGALVLMVLRPSF
jgi:uncharacterized membrane protein